MGAAYRRSRRATTKTGATGMTMTKKTKSRGDQLLGSDAAMQSRMARVERRVWVAAHPCARGGERLIAFVRKMTGRWRRRGGSVCVGPRRCPRRRLCGGGVP